MKRETYDEVARLLRKWDPIGVFELSDDWPDDEYDGYVEGVVAVVEGGGGVDAVADHLLRIQVEFMCLTPNPDNNRASAAAIVEAVRMS